MKCPFNHMDIGFEGGISKERKIPSLTYIFV